MHQSLSLPQRPPCPVTAIPGSVPAPAARTTAVRDPRWRPLVSRLTALRRHGRRAVRIVDVNCNDGLLLIQSVREARTLGFLAIEGVGIDHDPEHIHEAQWRARAVTDTAIGLEFHVAEPAAQLELEAAFPADIVLYEAAGPVSKALRSALERAGNFALRARPAALPVVRP